jgi:hypothetical protein
MVYRHRETTCLSIYGLALCIRATVPYSLIANERGYPIFASSEKGTGGTMMSIVAGLRTTKEDELASTPRTANTP